MTVRIVTDPSELEQFDASSTALCFEGIVEGDEEKMLGYIAELIDVPELTSQEVAIVPGALMNSTYGLTDDNAYPDDLRIGVVMVPIAARAYVPFLTPRDLRFFDNLVTNNGRNQQIINEAAGKESSSD